MNVKQYLINNFGYGLIDPCILSYMIYAVNVETYISTAYIRKVHRNKFLNSEQRDILLTISCKANRCYNKLRLYIRKKQYSKYTVANTHDMLFDPIHDGICLYSLMSVYKFNERDINNIILMSLTNHSCDFAYIPSPKKPANPYTNLAFQEHEIYTIYFQMRRPSKLLKIFFDCNFDIDKIIDRYWGLLYHKSLERYIKDVVIYSCDVQINYIKLMISCIKEIETDFIFPIPSSQTDLDIMRSILLSFIRVYYIVTNDQKLTFHLKNIYTELLKLKQSNPKLGIPTIGYQFLNTHITPRRNNMLNIYG